MTNSKQHKQAAGFTLIEVLISITVFAIGILAVITMQTSAVSGNAKAQNISEATNLAANQVESMLNTSYSSIVNNSAVSGNYKISWTVQKNVPTMNCKTITVTVKRVFNSQLKGVTNNPVIMNFVKVQDL